MNHLLCFGYGYTAQYIKKTLQNDPRWTISGTSRTPCNNPNMYVASENNLLDDSILSKATHVLVSVPPQNGEDMICTQYAHKLSHIKWLGYISSTSVYGDHQGKWVTEDSECKGKDIYAMGRLNAEQAWLQTNLPTHIFRPGGIYGIERNPIVKLKANKIQNIYKPDHFFSRIHVEDLANIIICSMNNTKPHSFYNCVDYYPSPLHEALEYGSTISGLPMPKRINYEDTKLTGFIKSIYENNRKVTNTLFRSLNYENKYKSYKDGLKIL